jgi:hypothetical protein
MGTQFPRDTSSKKRNVRELVFRDTSVGDELTLHRIFSEIPNLWSHLSVSQTTLELNTRVVEEGDRQSKNITLIDIVHLTPLQKPLF